MTTESETLVAAVRSGEMTDSGGMPTSQDIAGVVTDSVRSVDEKLRALDREGLITSTKFGDGRVWIVPDDEEDTPIETTPETPTKANAYPTVDLRITASEMI